MSIRFSIFFNLIYYIIIYGQNLGATVIPDWSWSWNEHTMPQYSSCIVHHIDLFRSDLQCINVYNPTLHHVIESYRDFHQWGVALEIIN